MKSLGRIFGGALVLVLGLVGYEHGALRAGIARAFATTFSYNGKFPVANSPGVPLGSYDPYGDFKEAKGDVIEHIFLPWQDVDLSTFDSAVKYARVRGRSLLISVEPWSWSKDRRVAGDQLRAGILAGRYDSNIAEVCGAAGRHGGNVMIRWAHEMEIRSGQFTWSGWAPADYIAAYRRFVLLCRKQAPLAKFVWSPKGESNMNDYYPGDQYVDIVGLSVFGLQQYDRDHFGHDRTFAEILAPSYALAAVHKKPVIVAEVGYAGDESYVKLWASSLTVASPAFPRLAGAVYFNQREIYAWPDPYGLPDWRVIPSNP